MMTDLKVKVCGMREKANILGIAAANPDFIGFIFYAKSSRFVGLEPSFGINSPISTSIKKVGVFVDEIPERVIQTCQDYHLGFAQLHGKESPQDCRKIQKAGIAVLKAFSVHESFDFKALEAYCESCQFFLFDTKGNLPGGTGTKFNWQLLNNYQLEVPFFLSGGIRPEDWNAVREFHHPGFYGVDINSGFEIQPALKDVDKVQQFIVQIKSKN